MVEKQSLFTVDECPQMSDLALGGVYRGNELVIQSNYSPDADSFEFTTICRLEANDISRMRYKATDQAGVAFVSHAGSREKITNDTLHEAYRSDLANAKLWK